MKKIPIDLNYLAAWKAQSQKQAENFEKRKAALSQPITAEDIIYHSQFLEAVPYGGDFCWIYTKKATGGRSGTYARLTFNGVKVQAHRFALAAKLGCTLWDLFGSNAGHAPISRCMGGRCCKHMHLLKEDSTALGAWQRSKDRQEVGTKPERTEEENKARARKMVRYMHKNGLPISDGQPLRLGDTRTIGTGQEAFTLSLV